MFTSSLISADLVACPVTGEDLPSFRLAISWASWCPVFGSVFVVFSLTRIPKVKGISVVEKDWAEFVLEGVSEAGSCLSGFLLFWFCWGDSAFTVVRNVWLKSCLDLFIGSFWAIMHSGIGDILCLYEPKEAVSEPIF